MKNRLSEILSIDFPIVQAPMFGVTTPQMVAAANRAGCLGSIALGDLEGEASAKIVRECRKLTNREFAANIFVNDVPEITDELKKSYNRTRTKLYELSEKLRLNVDLPDIESVTLKGYREQIEGLLSENIKILSFTFGNLDAETIDLLKNHNVTLIGTATSEDEAEQLIASGIDILCLQGIEAGGHRGSFSDENIPGTGGFSLLQNVREMTGNPIIYAGGIGSRQAIKSLELLGADGFQVGTMLLCSVESALTSAEKQRLTKASASEIVLTKSFSGRYARGLKNDFIDLFETSDFILPYPFQNKLTGPFRKAARVANLTEFVNLWTGQTVGNFSFNSTEEILKELR